MDAIQRVTENFKIGNYVEVIGPSTYDASYRARHYWSSYHEEYRYKLCKIVDTDITAASCYLEGCGTLPFAYSWLKPVTAVELEYLHRKNELEKETIRSYMNNQHIFDDVLGNQYKFTILHEGYFLGVPKIKKVIVNDPATIILWEDGEKTVVKCGENDTFDAEKGIAMAYIKRVMFDNKTTQMNKWFKQYTEMPSVQIDEEAKQNIKDAVISALASFKSNGHE